jgi:hypothetical protein
MTYLIILVTSAEVASWDGCFLGYNQQIVSIGIRVMWIDNLQAHPEPIIAEEAGLYSVGAVLNVRRREIG